MPIYVDMCSTEQPCDLFGEKKSMKLVLKVVAVVVSAAVVLYHGYFYVLPSVTVINNADITISNARVELPNSGLDFGSIEAKGKNTIYYSLEQSDGQYQFHITMADGAILSGRCGYVTNSEIHKRVRLLVTADQVSCDSPS
ncbi:hypothetical protein GCM10011369_08250 [Neiella marina]|uniref:Uncharacterized protein n=1 Tax=Neiella marina TaxID=508461 RepID=A0A8J2U352_9GAMM|nr:hypothetical protein [Neiella marina]GGA68968.1 hypothetical protein GCM10011369_08250 [Neiella marina]